MAKKKKIMVVDDDKKFLEELTETLRLSDYEPVTVGDSNLVLERVLEEVPDVILLDLKMYPKNGFEIAYALKHFVQVDGAGEIPIIAMTGFYKDGYMNLLDMCGIKRCLKKPFKPLDMIEQIEDVLRSGS